jgi:hypothetical protein
MPKIDERDWDLLKEGIERFAPFAAGMSYEPVPGTMTVEARFKYHPQVALLNLVAQARSEHEAQARVVEAARMFAGQPGFLLAEPVESAWLDLRAALTALDSIAAPEEETP